MHRTVVRSIVAALGSLTPAHATIVQYSSRALFNTAAGSLSGQDFESYAPTPGAFRGVTFDFGDFSAINEVLASNPNAGSIVAGGLVNGSTEMACAALLNGDPFLITFDRPILAFGFDSNNLADQRNDDLLFNNAAGDVIRVNNPLNPAPTRFYGFISDTPFTTFSVRYAGGASTGSPTDGFRLDNVALSAVPLPSAGALGMPALAALAAIRTRRRRWTTTRAPSASDGR